MSCFGCWYWRAGGLQLALPCLACWYLGSPSMSVPMPHPPHPLPMPRSHPLSTRARPPGPPGAQAGLGSGSLKSVVRACFLLPQSRAPLLFSSSAPAVLPLSSTTRQDSTKTRFGRRLAHQRPSRRLPAFHPSHVDINRRWSSPSHRLREKTHEKPALGSQSHTDSVPNPPRSPLVRLNPRDPDRCSFQPVSNTRHLEA